MTKRRRTKKSSIDPFGFSFLAVLSCVLGVVIFLLTYLTSYSGATEEHIKKTLDNLKDRMSVVVDERRKNDVDNRLKEQQKVNKQKELNDAKKKYKGVVSKLNELKNEIEKLGNEGDTIRLVSYGGDSGTTKTPVYVECKKNVIVLYPDKEVISKSYITKDNSYIRKLIESLKSNSQRKYALFLIHPTGFKVFKDISKIISESKINYGYEPVNSDWKLKLYK